MSGEFSQGSLESYPARKLIGAIHASVVTVGAYLAPIARPFVVLVTRGLYDHLQHHYSWHGSNELGVRSLKKEERSWKGNEATFRG